MADTGTPLADNPPTVDDLTASWQRARALGMDENDIWNYVQGHSYWGPKINSALSSGVSREDIIDHLGLFEPKVPAYGAADELTDALALGQGPRLKAASLSEAGFAPYEDTLSAINRQKQAYEKENPLTSAAIDVGGAVPAAVLTGGAVGAASRAVPYVGRFLAGEQGGNMLLRAASQGTAGALQGGAFGALEGEPGKGALGGAVLGTVGAPLVQAVTGSPLTPEVAGLAKQFIDAGIPLKTSNITGVGSVAPEQAAAFTRALANTFGTNLKEGEGLTQDVMNSTADRIGSQFDKATKNLHIDPSVPVGVSFDGEMPAEHLADRLDRLHNMVGSLTSPPANITKVLNDIESKASAGTISGEEYQALTNKTSPLGVLLKNADPAVRGVARYIRDTLDSSMEQTAQHSAYAGGGLTASTSAPLESLQLLQQSRREWKNMLTAEDLAEKSDVDGVVNPRLLQTQVRKFYPDYAYTGTPGSDIGALAKGGNQFLSGPRTEGQSTLSKIVPSKGFARLIGADLLGGGALLGAEHFLTNVPTSVGAGVAAGVPLVVAGARAIARRPNALISRSLGAQPEGTFGPLRRALLPLFTQ